MLIGGKCWPFLYGGRLCLSARFYLLLRVSHCMAVKLYGAITRLPVLDTRRKTDTHYVQVSLRSNRPSA